MKLKSKEKRIKRLENQAIKLKDCPAPECEGLSDEHKRPSKLDRLKARILTLTNSK